MICCFISAWRADKGFVAADSHSVGHTVVVKLESTTELMTMNSTSADGAFAARSWEAWPMRRP